MASSATRAVLGKLGESAHLLALAVWFGAVAMSAVVAATVFPTMRTLDPTLGAYPDFTGDHANLAAGHVAARVFLIADAVQLGAGTLALGTMVVLILVGLPIRRWSTGIRLSMLGAALAGTSFHLLILGPGMQHNLDGYWRSAAAGDSARAESYRQAFADEHPTASRSLAFIGGTVLATFAASSWSAQRRRSEPSE